MSKTSGTVTVWLKIPWETHTNDESKIDMAGLERHAEDTFRGALCAQCMGRLKQIVGIDLYQDIETTATFEADQDPGGEG